MCMLARVANTDYIYTRTKCITLCWFTARAVIKTVLTIVLASLINHLPSLLMDSFTMHHMLLLGLELICC